jgi:hypothetical protein
VGDDVSVDSEALLVINFMNLKIKSAQSFEGAHRSKVCVRVFIGMCAHICMSICICLYCVSKKKVETDSGG